MRRVTAILVPLLVLVMVLPAYLRVYSVAGDSDAPNYRTGDTLLGLLAAYDLTLPYTSVRIARFGDPQVGDVVLFESPEGGTVFKRLVARPGDTVEIREHRLLVNGKELLYDRLPESDVAAMDIPAGGVPRREIQETSIRVVLLSGDAAAARFGPLAIPEGYYFVMGDNRSYSRDSRHYGAIPRERILGRALTKLTSGKDAS